MIRTWTPEELAHHFTLSAGERVFLGHKGAAATLHLAALLKTFQVGGEFLDRPQAVPAAVIDVLSQQLGLSPALWAEVDWSTRTARRYRDEVAHFCGFRAFRAPDGAALIAHLTPLVADLNPDSESLRQRGRDFLRGQRLVPPTAQRFSRCLRAAVGAQEEHWMQSIQRRLSPQPVRP
ncbi:DUF4158 domain-containing protein [Deinococcus koreensis]|uniref:DUF4158 domain-containing protein n=1 Tax=Deinococcus koreensis TaxID=2054903 RepID=UPI0013FD44EC|nr:DUF4158 domain-containing protein [Deinococcus koreensis]